MFSVYQLHSKQKRLRRSGTIRFMYMTFELSLLTESDIVFTTRKTIQGHACDLWPLCPKRGQSALTKSVHHLCEPTGALSTWCALNGEMVCLIECLFPGIAGPIPTSIPTIPTATKQWICAVCVCTQQMSSISCDECSNLQCFNATKWLAINTQL